MHQLYRPPVAIAAEAAKDMYPHVPGASSGDDSKFLRAQALRIGVLLIQSTEADLRDLSTSLAPYYE